MTTYQQTMDAGSQARGMGIPPGYLNGHIASSDTGLHHHQPPAAGTAAQLHDDNPGGILNHFTGLSLPAGSLPAPAMHSFPPGAYVNGPDGSIIIAAPYPGPLHPFLADHAYGASAYPIQYQPGAYAPAYAPGTMVPFTPGRPVTYGDRLPRDVPGLENRRSSYSTSATESAPATPFFGNGADRMNGGTRVASLERSSFTTPSPRETTSFMATHAHSKVKADPDIERLLTQDPPIPRAVPAVWTDHIKPLEQCLENCIQGNRNVYIRGLHPTTDDNLLLRYTERFGEVEQSKAIIDIATGACKGFGFAKFRDVKNSERCIRGFYLLGYEVGFARESFNARLKAEGDESSTNLYISNLPKDINESMLSQIFEPFHIVSSKILRDSMGNSRGVGFARFETRDICEKVIRNFHGMTVGQQNYIMQVRYADTPAQKDLKRITAERRQYRTNEYNIGAYGTHAVGINPSIYIPPVSNQRTGGNRGYRHSSVPLASQSSVACIQVDTTRCNSSDEKSPVPAVDHESSDEGSGDEGATVTSVIVVKGSPKSISSEVHSA